MANGKNASGTADIGSGTADIGSGTAGIGSGTPDVGGQKPTPPPEHTPSPSESFGARIGELHGTQGKTAEEILEEQ